MDVIAFIDNLKAGIEAYELAVVIVHGNATGRHTITRHRTAIGVAARMIAVRYAANLSVV